MKYIYKPINVCAQSMEIDVEDNIIKEVKIEKGCQGNLLGISKIMVNKTIDEVIEAFSGIDCHRRGTSCPDQISIFLQLIKEGKANIK